MADTFKVLGQAFPLERVLTDAYTVPGATSTVVSTFKAANQAATATTFRVTVAVAGAADEAKQCIYPDVALAANDTFSATEGWTMAATDVVRVQSANGSVSFNIFGSEIT